MPTVVIPFAGAEGKTRLHASAELRVALARAMFRDVLAASVSVGRTRVVTPDDEAAEAALDAGAEVVTDPGGGQGAAVAEALAGVEPGVILVVNADLPAVVPADFSALLEAAPALVEATDGTTNALSLPAPDFFAPHYGPGSAERFRTHTHAVSVDLPNLADDVDTMADLARLGLRAGPHTQAALAELEGSLV